MVKPQVIHTTQQENQRALHCPVAVMEVFRLIAMSDRHRELLSCIASRNTSVWARETFGAYLQLLPHILCHSLRPCLANAISAPFVVLGAFGKLGRIWRIQKGFSRFQKGLTHLLLVLWLFSPTCCPLHLLPSAAPEFAPQWPEWIRSSLLQSSHRFKCSLDYAHILLKHVESESFARADTHLATQTCSHGCKLQLESPLSNMYWGRWWADSEFKLLEKASDLLMDFF